MGAQGPKAKKRTKHIMAVKLFLVKFRVYLFPLQHCSVLYYQFFLMPSLGEMVGFYPLKFSKVKSK